MITLQAVLRSHKAVRDLWAVARVHVVETEGDGGGLQPGTELAAKGDLLGAAAVGELLRLEGELVLDPKWGRQLHVERQESLGIQHEQEAHRWLERLSGVGPSTARKLHAHFQGKVLEVLREDPGVGADPLLEVVGAALAKTIRESWGSIGAQGDPETLAWLDGLGLTRYEVNRVLAAAKKHHETAKVFLQTDPYRLTGEKGFGFARSDNVALRAGVSREAPARVDAATEFQIKETCAQDTVAPLGKLIDDVVKLAGVKRELVAEGIYRTARAGRGVVITEDGQGVLVHPTALLEAERAIHEWAVGPVAGGKRAQAPTQGQDLAPGSDVEFDLTPDLIEAISAPGAPNEPDPPTEVVIDVDPVTAARLAGEITRLTCADVVVLDHDQEDLMTTEHEHAGAGQTGRNEPAPTAPATAGAPAGTTPAALPADPAALLLVPVTGECNCDAGWLPDQVDHDPWCATLNPPLAVPTEELLARADRQELVCELAGVDLRAPAGGACGGCGRNVYEFVDGSVPLDACPNTECKKGF